MLGETGLDADGVLKLELRYQSVKLLRIGLLGAGSTGSDQDLILKVPEAVERPLSVAIVRRWQYSSLVFVC